MTPDMLAKLEMARVNSPLSARHTAETIPPLTQVPAGPNAPRTPRTTLLTADEPVSEEEIA